MITLQNIELQDDENIVISFSYEGNHMNFSGTMDLSKNEWIKSRHMGDEYLVQLLLQRELHFMINWMGD